VVVVDCATSAAPEMATANPAAALSVRNGLFTGPILSVLLGMSGCISGAACKTAGVIRSANATGARALQARWTATNWSIRWAHWSSISRLDVHDVGTLLTRRPDPGQRFRELQP
jgi:hypothetical protein